VSTNGRGRAHKERVNMVKVFCVHYENRTMKHVKIVLQRRRRRVKGERWRG
jgi:hypothetical protein